LNETQNVDLTVERENKDPNSRKKGTNQSEWKKNENEIATKYRTHTETLKKY